MSAARRVGIRDGDGETKRGAIFCLPCFQREAAAHKRREALVEIDDKDDDEGDEGDEGTSQFRRTSIYSLETFYFYFISEGNLNFLPN